MFVYCSNNPVTHSDSMGQKYIESIDTNGDGEPDCEVYSYTVEADVIVAIGPYFTVHLAETGKIYFLTTITEPDDLDNPDNWPEGYDATHDFLCIDSLNYEPDPNIHLHNSSNCWAEPKMHAITKEIEEYGNIHTNPNYGWGREAYEMVGEWQSHNNVIFSFSKQAKHVDFDRNEKNKGFVYFLLKAFKRALEIMLILLVYNFFTINVFFATTIRRNRFELCKETKNTISSYTCKFYFVDVWILISKKSPEPIFDQ